MGYSRNENILIALINGDTSNLPPPLSRVEALLMQLKDATGKAPVMSIGVVETLPAGSDATVTMTGTAEYPVLNFGIPQGDDGDVVNANIDMEIVNGELIYSCTDLASVDFELVDGYLVLEV